MKAVSIGPYVNITYYPSVADKALTFEALNGAHDSFELLHVFVHGAATPPSASYGKHESLTIPVLAANYHAKLRYPPPHP